MTIRPASPADLPPDRVAWNHSPRVVFDDSVLADQAVFIFSPYKSYHISISFLYCI